MIDHTITRAEAFAAPKVRERIGALDLVRGVCAVGVAIYHFVSWNLGVQIESLGSFGVYTFFVLSGLTMAYVYSAGFKDTLNLETVHRFYIRRVARILPLLAVAAVGAWLFARWQHGVGLAEGLPLLILTGSGFLAAGPAGFLSNAVGAWSLGIEIVFYALFPIAALLSQHLTLRRLVVVVGTATAAQQIYLMSIAQVDNHWHYYISPLTFGPFFALGMLILRLPIPASRWNMPASALLLAIVFGYSSVLAVDLYKASLHYLILMMTSTGAVALAFHAKIPHVLTRPAAFLGEISYALYLTHWFADYVANRVGGSDLTIKFLVFSIVALAQAYAVYRIVEVPAGRWVKRWLGGFR